MRYHDVLFRSLLAAVFAVGAVSQALAVQFNFYGSDTPTGAALGFVQEDVDPGAGVTLVDLRRKEITSTSDINLLSNVVYAINGAPSGNNQTVDVGGTSVFFENMVDSQNVTYTLSDFAAGNFYNRDTGDTGLNAVINSQAFNGSASTGNGPTLTLSNLTSGQNYRVQIIGAGDTRNFDELNPTPIRFHDVGSGNADGTSDGGSIAFIDRMGDPNGDGTWNAVTAIADFTANATTQVLAFGTDSFAQGTSISGVILSSDTAGTATGLPALSIDRSNGQITLRNPHPTGSFSFTNVSLTSAAGSINSGSTAGSTLGPGQQVVLGETWEQVPFQDVVFELTLTGGSPQSFGVQYEGDAIGIGDLDGDGDIDSTDWTQFKAGSNTDLTGLSKVAGYQMGDLNGDLEHGLADFQIFKSAFNAANGAGSFAAVFAVPEPSTFMLAAMCCVGFAASRRRGNGKRASGATAAMAIALLAFLPAVASAQITWKPSVNMYQGSTVETFVNTDGDLAVALNASGDTSGDQNPTVNGVAFTGTGTGVTLGGAGTETITLSGGSDNVGSFGDGEFSSNANIFHLIRGAVFGVSSVTLGGLDIGQTYSMQVFNNDARGNRHLNYVTGYGDGSGTSTAPVAFSELNNSPVNGDAPVFPQTDAGDSITGTFLASSASLTFNVFGSTGGVGGTFTQGDGRAQINGIQLRRIDAIPDPLKLVVDTSTGAMTIENTNATLPITFDAYEIKSAGDSLDEVQWAPLADGGVTGFPAGDGSGNGWEESPNADEGALIEWYLQSASGGSTSADFDSSDTVDGSDFLTWQRNIGFTFPGDLQPFGDANGDDAIDGADLAIWQDEYGNDGSASATPLNAGQSISLGNGYDESVDAQDLVFTYNDINGDILQGIVEYVTPAVGALPEPTTATLAALFGIAAMCGSRRSGRLG